MRVDGFDAMDHSTLTDLHKLSLIGIVLIGAVAQHFRLLTEQHVHSLLPMSDLIAAMESALAKFSAGEVLQPVRSVLMVGPTKAYFGVMPAYVPSPASLGAKLVTVFGENHKKQLPSHLATILLLDPETGSLIALMDGRYITEARTAAVSAVSARFLARADAAGWRSSAAASRRAAISRRCSTSARSRRCASGRRARKAASSSSTT